MEYRQMTAVTPERKIAMKKGQSDRNNSPQVGLHHIHTDPRKASRR